MQVSAEVKGFFSNFGTARRSIIRPGLCGGRTTAVTRSLGRHPLVQVAMRLGRPLQVELLDIDRSERLGGDQCLHVPIQVTPVGEAYLQPVQAALPLLDARLWAEAV